MVSNNNFRFWNSVKLDDSSGPSKPTKPTINVLEQCKIR